MAELAARLGSLNVYHRGGQTVWFDRFDGGFSPWQIEENDETGSWTITTEGTEWGGYAGKLTSPSGGVGSITLMHRMSSAEINKWGIEVGVAFTSEFECFNIALARYTEDRCQYGSFEVNRAENKFRVWNRLTGWENVGDLYVVVDENVSYHNMKLIIDMENLVYVRALFDEHSFDLREYELFNSGVDWLPQQTITIRFYGRDGSHDTAQLGHVLVTVGEP